ncbi:MAG TPA: hypothetical protein PKM47_17375, partial [Mycobacterium sp.]|nr:hypothetical protein [Mycobacterium sp.]
VDGHADERGDATMNLRLTRVTVACGLATTLVVATASCSFVPRAHETQDQAAPAAAAPPAVVAAAPATEAAGTAPAAVVPGVDPAPQH